MQASHLSTFWHLDGQREETLKKDFRDSLNWGVGGGAKSVSC